MVKAKARFHSDLNVILELIYLFGTVLMYRLVAINCEDFKSLLIKSIPLYIFSHSCTSLFVYIAGFRCSRFLLCSRFIWQFTATKGGTFHRDLDSGGGGDLLKAKRFVVILDPLVAEHHVLSVGDI